MNYKKKFQGKPRNRIIATSKRLASYRKIYPRQDPTEDKRNKKKIQFQNSPPEKGKGEGERKSTQQFSLEM